MKSKTLEKRFFVTMAVSCPPGPPSDIEKVENNDVLRVLAPV